MSITLTRLGAITTVPVTAWTPICTGTAGTVTHIDAITISNISSAATSASVCIRPDTGTAASSSNALIWNYILPGYSFYTLGAHQVLSAGEIVSVYSSTTSTMCIISGEEIT